MNPSIPMLWMAAFIRHLHDHADDAGRANVREHALESYVRASANGLLWGQACHARDRDGAHHAYDDVDEIQNRVGVHVHVSH